MRPFLFYSAAAFIVICDQITKWAITRTFPYGASEKTFVPFLYLTHTRNTGGAFSLLQARNSWFIVIAAVAMIALAFAYHRSARRDLWVSAALSLALGGAIGNLIDRVRFGYVIDFFDIKVWPVFNVADSAITIGILILAWTFLFKRDPQPDVLPAAGPLPPVQSEGLDKAPAADLEAAGRRPEAVELPAVPTHDSSIATHSDPERQNT